MQAAEGRKRRRAALWAAGAVAGALLLGLVATTLGLVHANAARRDAEAAEQSADAARSKEAAERRRAEDSLAEARAIDRHLNKLLGELKSSPRPGARSEDLTIRELLDQAARDAGASFAGRPRLEAAVRYAIGENYEAIGQIAAAAGQYEQALRLREAHLGPTHPTRWPPPSAWASAATRPARPTKPRNCTSG